MLTPDQLYAMALGRGIALNKEKINQPRGGAVPQSHVQMCGLALAGLPEKYVYAVAYRWGRDGKARHYVYGALMNEALRLADRENWPSRMQGRRYLESLVLLSLMDEHHWWILHTAQLHAAAIEFDDDVWLHRLAKRYEAIRIHLDVWCDIAYSHMRRKLSFQTENQCVA